ncbi:MAG: hypothetical protein WBW58_00790 [Candidatus Acidiferrum sp.]
MTLVFAGSSLAVKALVVLNREIGVEHPVHGAPVIEAFGNQDLAGHILRREHGTKPLVFSIAKYVEHQRTCHLHGFAQHPQEIKNGEIFRIGASDTGQGTRASRSESFGKSRRSRVRKNHGGRQNFRQTNRAQLREHIFNNGSRLSSHAVSRQSRGQD